MIDLYDEDYTPSLPVDLIGASDQLPQLPWLQQQTVTQAPANLMQKIQELVGAKQPDQGGTVSDILSSRFPGTSYSDYAQGVVQSAMGKPTLGNEVAASRTTGLMKQMESIANLEKLSAQADLYKRGGTGSNGATMQIIQGLMKANPGMTFDQALYQYQTGNRSNTKLTSGGIEPITGAADTKKTMNRAASSGTEEGKITTEAQANLPTVIDNAQTSINVITEALNHPGLDANFGKMGVIPNVPGGEAADAKALLDQIQGGGFLTAYGQLRGGGQISNVEGEKATTAYVRMQKAQSAPAFRQAAREYIGIIQKGVARAKNAAAGVNFNPQQSGQPQTEDDPLGIR